jgi:diacylglycerol O-acyltransferase
MTELFENYVKGVWFVAEAVTGVLRAVRGRLSGTSEPDPMPAAVSATSGPVPASVFHAPLTERRAVAFVSIPLADLAAVSRAFGGTVTNVFLAACTLSVRAWLERYDTVPDGPLLVEMPLPLPGDDPTIFGNPLAIGRIRIPVQLDDPVQVLTNLHTATDRLNTARMHDAKEARPRVDLVRIASLIPPTFVHAGMRLYAGLGVRQWLAAGCHGSVSYVSGQPVPVYCAGSKVVSMHTVVPLREGCGLNITLASRGDVMDVSVCVCPDNVPAVEDIATGIAESVDILVAAALKSPRGQGRSVVTQMTSPGTKRSNGRRR